MPRIYRYSANLIWSLFYLLKMKGNFKNIIEVYYELRHLKKHTVSNDTISYIRNKKGRLLY